MAVGLFLFDTDELDGAGAWRGGVSGADALFTQRTEGRCREDVVSLSGFLSVGSLGGRWGP